MRLFSHKCPNTLIIPLHPSTLPSPTVPLPQVLFVHLDSFMSTFMCGFMCLYNVGPTRVGKTWYLSFLDQVNLLKMIVFSCVHLPANYL